MRAQDYVQNNIAYHDTLNPVAWQGDRMRPEVRLKLLKIAHVFVDYIEIADFDTLDIVLTGSMANYNWTKFSDFDIHVVTRYSDLECDDIVAAFYQAKKQIWNKQHDILIRGHEAELYVEDIDQPPVSGGIYSLLRGEWSKQPDHEVPNIDSRAVNIKVQDLIHQIDDALDTANSADDIKRVTDKIRKMRRVGLDRAGEFSVENLAFKVLRNEGYIDRLSQAHLHQQDAELSLTEALLRGLAAQDQAERNEYEKFVQSQAGGDYTQGAKLWAEKKKRPANDVFGDLARQQQFMKMKFNFDKFTEQDWDDYWVMAQHCDHTRQFQQQALGIIKQYLGTENSHYRYLSDRISCGLSGTQKYGTQNICNMDAELSL